MKIKNQIIVGIIIGIVLGAILQVIIYGTDILK